MAIRKVVLQTKAGYQQEGYSRGVLLILLALDTVCRRRMKGVPRTLTLTSGTEDHATGGHARREALDVRSKTFRGSHAAAVKRRFLFAVIVEAVGVDGGRVWSPLEEEAVGYEVYSAQYYAVLEYEGTPREHFHIQVRRGQTIGLPPAEIHHAV